MHVRYRKYWTSYGVSCFESPFPFITGRRYPVYLFHWHPAKSQFEWRRDLDINHSFRAVLAGQYFANFFVREGELNIMKSYSLCHCIN